MIRLFDIIFSLFGLWILTPIFLLISILIKTSSKGPIFFIQKRVGLNNLDINVYKFRTMYINLEKGGLLTIGENDPRITSIGNILRKFKLDELPQLFNVLKGDMSLVGPRPEVRKYVDLYNDDQKKILFLKPGITDWASIKFINENELFNNSLNPETLYVNEILPKKLELSMGYNYTLKEYFKIIFSTILKILKG